MVVWTDAVSVLSPDWLFWMNGFLLCTIFLTWQTSLLHPSSRASSFKLLLAREALSSTILSFVMHHRSNCPLHAPGWWSRSWRSLSNSSSFSHRSFVLIARVGRFERFGVITLLNNFCISCRWAADWLISWSGHPRPSHCWAPVYRGCPCRDPPVWWSIQAGWWVTKAPTLFCCSALGFCYTDWTLDVFTCDITKLDQCCVLILRRRKIKPNWDVTWRDLHGWKTQLILTRSSQPCEYTFAFTIVLLRCSLDLRLVHSVLSRCFSHSLYCEVHVVPDSHHLLSLDFHHLADGGKLGLQLASALPSLLALTWPLRINIDHGLLDLPRHSLPRRSRF